ncbi:apolipoprotein D [Folsomia candida]|uniref:Apolipoprotein D n=1 Tax=Folsomia candida TaxID=158441 RepID=A0A226D4V3_FOLCA|nr:apolipoprotein D [Folsomia candida]OXA39767.1 Apolipoprotein D [Folsomia candida]
MSTPLILWCLLIITIKLTEGQHPVPGRCPKVEPFKYIDVQRYGGLWYEVERFFFLPEVTGSCITVNYDPQKDGSLATTIRLKESVTGKKLAFPGNTIFLDSTLNKNFTIGNMQLTLELFNPILPQPKFQYTYSYKLADTDYDNYIIKFGCVSLLAVHFESVWILSRYPSYPARVERLVHNSLDRLGIDRSLLVRSKCDEIQETPKVFFPTEYHHHH